MKKILNKKLYILTISFMLLALIISIIMHLTKYSDVEWLKYFDDLSGLRKISKFSFWWYIGTNELYGTIAYIFPIILLTASCYSFFTIYHSGYFQNIILIAGYKKSIVSEILKSWLYSLILPIISLISFFISGFIYPNKKILAYSETDGFPFQLVNKFMESINPYVFIVIYMLLLILFGIIIINIGLCFARYIKKYYLSCLASFITIIFFENFNNLLIAPLVAKITGITKMANGFSIYNIYYLDSCPSFLWMIIFTILLFCLTSIILFKIYNKKEDVVLDYE